MRGVNQNSIIRVSLFLILASLVVTSVYGDNLTVDTYTIHSDPYTPFPIFVVTFALGIGFMVLSFVLSNEQNADAFSAIAIIPLFISAWMATQLDFPVSGIAGTATSSIARVDHHIYPSTLLAIVIFLLAVIQIFQTYRLLTSDSGIPEQTQGSSAYKEEQNEDNRY